MTFGTTDDQKISSRVSGFFSKESRAHEFEPMNLVDALTQLVGDIHRNVYGLRNGGKGGRKNDKKTGIGGLSKV